MEVYSLLILNKAGGLIYQKDLNPKLSKLSANDYLVLAGTLHGAHAIASKLKPDGSKGTHEESQIVNSNILISGKAHLPNVNKLGLSNIDTDLFSLYVFQTLTGVKFIIITSPVTAVSVQAGAISALKKQFESASQIYKQCYLYYCDYVMKDPFYSLDMPIKSTMFESKILSLTPS